MSVTMLKTHLLDGSQSTQLEKYVDQVTDHPLWVCKYLYENPTAVKMMHYDYIEAGADIVTTLTYQVSIENLMSSYKISPELAIEIIQSSVRLAKSAWDEFNEKTGLKKKAIVAGSIGPFGAFLRDGSEYTGTYIDTMTTESLIEFHRPRVKALVDAGADLLCFETLPSKMEGLALIQLLREFPNARAWLSFTCKDGNITARGEKFGESVAECWKLSRGSLIAVGCNCTHPDLVKGLLESAQVAIKEEVPFVVYSNSGEVYDSEKGSWTGVKKDLGGYLYEWLPAGVKYVGGCCRTDVKDIRNMRQVLDSMPHNL